MAEKGGKFQICERCGSAIFIERIDCEVVGGWLGDIFEEREEFKKHNEIGYLCPACEDAYKNIMCDFMDNEHHEITINGGKKEFYNFKERAESE